MVTGENSLLFATGFDNSGLKQGKFDAIRIVSSLGQAIGKINPFAALAVGAVAAFATIANEAFQFQKRYEKAMLEVRTISKAVNNDFRGISKDIFNLSERTLDDPVKLAEAYYQIVSAGYDGAEGLRLLETASKAATAGVTDTQTAADGITTVLNAFGESASNSEEIADAFFKTVQLGKTTFSELAANISQVAPLASALGVSYNEVLAAVASLTKQGVPTAQAMTQIRSALISVNENLAEGWSETYTFQEALQVFADKANGSTKKLTQMSGRIEAVGAILATTGDNAESAAKDLEELENAAGSAGKAFQVMASGQLSQLQILRNRIKSVTESLGQGLLDVANAGLKTILDLSQPSNFSADLYIKEKEALYDLKLELKEVSTPIERRKEIIEELQGKYPAFLKNIQNEGLYTEELGVALGDINEQLLKRFQLEANKEEIQKVALEILEQETKEREEQVILDRMLAKVNSQAYRDRLRYEENLKGRQLDRFEKVELLTRLSNKQFAQYGVQAAELQKPQKELEKLRARFAELTQTADETKKGIVDFGKDTAAGIGQAGENLDNDLITFREYLENKRKAYEAYEDQIIFLGKERADEVNKNLISEANTYFDFLQKKLELYRGSVEKEKAIAEAAKKAGISALDTPEVQKVDVIIQPRVENIELSQNSLSKLIRKLENDLKNSPALSGTDTLSAITSVAERQINELDKINAIKRLKLKELYLFEGKLSDELFAERKKEIIDQNESLTKSILKNTDALLRDIPQRVIDDALLGTDLSFQNLNAATLGQLNEIEKKLRDIKLDSGELLDLGLDEGQVNRLLELFDKIKNNNLNNIDTAQAQRIGDIFTNVGTIMSRAGDDITQAVGNLAISLGNAFSTLGDENATSLQKASGLVGLIIQAGNLMQQVGEERLNENVNAQREVNKGLFQQLTVERKINEIRRERQEIERNSSAFLDTYYKNDYNDALQRQAESERQLNDAVKLLSENAILSAEGVGKRLLGGTKTELRNFSIEDIFGEDFTNFFLTTPGDGKLGQGRFFDPLSIFGGYSDINVSNDALKQLRNSFEETLRAMGKTSADMANFSSREWLDFFSVLDELGNVTDENTKRLLENAQEALAEYEQALEDMRDIISDFAGSLGDDLGNALVKGFQTGEDAAQIFKTSVSRVLQDLFLSELINTQFRSYFDQLQEEMEQSFQAGGDQSWIDDIQNFGDSIEPALQQGVEAMEAFNQELLDLGYEGFGNRERQGLTGGITTITEDTASVLAGTINGIRIDVSLGLEISREANVYLSNISQRSDELVEIGNNQNVRLQNIEKALT